MSKSITEKPHTIRSTFDSPANWSRIKSTVKTFVKEVKKFKEGFIVKDRSGEKTLFGLNKTSDTTEYTENDDSNNREDLVFIDFDSMSFTFFNKTIDNVDTELRKRKINYIIEQLTQFNVLQEQHFLLISMDAPKSLAFSFERFHQDSLPIFFLETSNKDFFTRLFNSSEVGFNSKITDYTIIQYLNNSVSTTIGIDMEVRFRANNGTVLCIKNDSTKHSAPYIITKNERMRKFGNSFQETLIKEEIEKNNQKFVYRNLYRTQVKQLSEEKVHYIKQYISRNPDKIETIVLSEEELLQMEKPRLKEKTFNEYFSSKSNRFAFEYGGTKRNRKIDRKTKKNKK